ncbi:MAG: NAD-dependent epimerase/dehydratase family protein [Terriglobia bacterium]
MKAATVFPNGLLVTGSEGFVGSGLCAHLAAQRDLSRPQAIALDLTRPEHFDRLPRGCRVRAVFHLAVRGRVLVARREMSAHCADTIDAAVNVLELLNPGVFIFSSSCAVYGDTRETGARPSQSGYRPRGVYALSKIAVELIAAQWAAANRRAAVIFRFGNVVGTGCGGLIRYLTRHALQYPQGEKPAQLRGAGRIVRDYVPLHYVTQVLSAAADHRWKPGSTTILNMGTGRGLTNAAVAARMKRELANHGYELNVAWDPEPAPEEAMVSMLDVSRTGRLFGIPPASPQAVWDAIDEAVRGHLEDARADAETHPPGRCRDAALPPSRLSV